MYFPDHTADVPLGTQAQHVMLKLSARHGLQCASLELQLAYLCLNARSPL